MTRERDYKRFVELLEWAKTLTTMPNGKELGAMALAMFDELAQYPFELVAASVRVHCRSEKFFPMLADIVKRIEGTEADAAATAWAMVLKAMRKWGYYDSVRFPDPAIHYAISQMGGWIHLCSTLRDETEPFRKKDFAGYYAVGRRTREAIPAYLTGQHEAENRLHGHALPRQVWDVRTGQRVPEHELPALEGGQAAGLVRLVAGGMEATA